MSLFMKQDFTPSILSRKWIAMKFRRNMLLYNREHIISILESGLMFREDSIEVEQETPSEDIWKAAGGWLTTGEWGAGIALVTMFVAVVPPRSVHRLPLHVTCYLSLCALIRTTHRLSCRGTLRELLHIMRDYLSLARRAAACMRDTNAVKGLPISVTSTLDSLHTLLCRQQSSLTALLSRASHAVLGNAPWLRGDRDIDEINVPDDQLLKIHHAFLVVQSTLLKHIAMAHYIPTPHLQKIYKNHNERIYWIHTVLIQHLIDEFKQYYESLERMYRILKNYGNKDSNPNKKPGKAITDSWLYSDVHSSIARTCLDLKMTTDKCNNLDMFLDSCALNKQDIDLNVLNKDIDEIIDELTKCLNTAQASQIRLKKLQSKFSVNEAAVETVNSEIESPDEKFIEIDDKLPEVKDEVFYFIKTDDNDDKVAPYEGDVSIGPGKKERETTKTVLNELRRKLVKREDVMRERERQALAKTMPELKDNVPEFPRQIKTDELNTKGYINKVKRNENSKRLFRKYKIQSKITEKFKGFRLKFKRYVNEDEIHRPLFEANAKLNLKSKLLTVNKDNKHTIITKWDKIRPSIKEFEFSDLSEGTSDVESNSVNKVINQAVNLNHAHQSNGAINLKFSKQDLELSPSSESDSDHEHALLNDVRKHRVARRKNHPARRAVDKVDDESLRPIEYSFCTGMAMASMLQVNSSKMPNMAQEDVFVGDGEVSEDSGNDEDA